ncbi:19527_t:CDS:2, partial [Funneliformis geosporum]
EQECVFCVIANNKDSERIVYEDERIIAFEDKKPAAKMHLLIIPRNHIDTVKTLSTNDVPLLRHMIDTGNRLLSESGYQLPQTRMGFHVPPYYSVKHLHLHCLGLPFRNRFIGIRYTELMPWYCSGEKILNSLSSG